MVYWTISLINSTFAAYYSCYHHLVIYVFDWWWYISITRERKWWVDSLGLCWLSPREYDMDTENPSHVKSHWHTQRIVKLHWSGGGPYLCTKRDFEGSRLYNEHDMSDYKSSPCLLHEWSQGPPKQGTRKLSWLALYAKCHGSELELWPLTLLEASGLQTPSQARFRHALPVHETRLYGYFWVFTPEVF